MGEGDPLAIRTSFTESDGLAGNGGSGRACHLSVLPERYERSFPATNPVQRLNAFVEGLEIPPRRNDCPAPSASGSPPAKGRRPPPRTSCPSSVARALSMSALAPAPAASRPSKAPLQPMVGRNYAEGPLRLSWGLLGTSRVPFGTDLRPPGADMLYRVWISTDNTTRSKAQGQERRGKNNEGRTTHRRHRRVRATYPVL